MTVPRLYVSVTLQPDRPLPLDRDQTHYLAQVLRLGTGADVLVFDGGSGEWRARLTLSGKHSASLTPYEQTRAQTDVLDIHYLFAPIKRARIDYLAQKAAEMGVARLRPVITDHTNAERVNLERLRANVIEAAEQCGLLSIADVAEPEKLSTVLDRWEATDPGRHIVFCDEGAGTANPVEALAGVPSGPVALLIGPEGGFSAAERARLHARADVTALSLGPRILRADTAAVAALAVLQSAMGDWAAAPRIPLAKAPATHA